MKVTEKCEQILASDKVTPGRRKHVEQWLRLMTVCPQVYPLTWQLKAINGLHKEYCTSDLEKELRASLGL